eukprot:14027024-Ditylum_brightwellii.AAC.1
MGKTIMNATILTEMSKPESEYHATEEPSREMLAMATNSERDFHLDAMDVPEDESSIKSDENCAEVESLLGVDELSVMLEDFAIDEEFSVGTFPIDASSVGEESANIIEQLYVVQQGPSTDIYRLPDPQNKFGGLTGYIVIKSLTTDIDQLEEDPGDLLENEYSVSKYLPKCSAVRAAFAQTKLHGVQAIILEWVNGIALSEWIRLFHEKRRSPHLTSPCFSAFLSEQELRTMLQLAINILNALTSIHDADVIHNNLIPGNVIVESEGDNENILVKVIGLGRASILTSNSKNTSIKLRDLLSFGSILFEMFTGKSPFRIQSDREESYEKKDIQNQTFFSKNELISLLTARVPLVLARLTLHTMGIDTFSQLYQSAQDIQRDLYTIMTNLEPIISNPKNQVHFGRLQFPEDRLYGRDPHLSELME